MHVDAHFYFDYSRLLVDDADTNFLPFVSADADPPHLVQMPFKTKKEQAIKIKCTHKMH